MNFFHRPKTPTLAPRHPAHAESQQLWRPKLSERMASFPSHRPSQDEAALSLKEHSIPMLREGAAVRPFDFLVADDERLYVGSPKPLRLVETIHAKLMSDLKEELSAKYNGDLCFIFESYRDILQENARLFAKERQTFSDAERNRQAYEENKRKWLADEADYKQEIKRLEKTIAYSDDGLELVIQAHRDSVIRKNHKPAPTHTTRLKGLDDSTQRKPKVPDQHPHGSRHCDMLPSKLPVRQERSNAVCGDSAEPDQGLGVGSSKLTLQCADTVANIAPPGAASDASKSRPYNFHDSDHDPLLLPFIELMNISAQSHKKSLHHNTEPKTATSAMHISSTLSNFMPWNGRKHHRLIDMPAMAEQTTNAGTTTAPTATTKPLAKISERDRGRRPISYFQGDELDFEQSQLPRQRQRSVSISEPPAMGALSLLVHPEQMRSRDGRSNSLDTIRRPYSLESAQELTLDTNGALVRGNSQSSVLTATRIASSRAQKVSRVVDGSQWAGRMRGGFATPVQDTSKRTTTASLSPNNVIIEPTGPDGNLEPHLAATAVAKAVVVHSDRIGKENGQRSSDTNKMVDKTGKWKLRIND